ncbi:TniQ family protein [Pseudomonas sp. TNT3]|uniref:TniQ family protein n=1 Tax=Pseudomonas sp. TNT3 TaxID=2654097 RepID=UPI001391BAAE|nr:TniQ family protein [Pseudomonas sp. TNT3]KAI2684095.1 TniQ family protein [Pseudomonas sp. TNT3]
MDKLCYIPKPAEFESPTSLLMRMAHYNGFGTVSNMCTYFTLKPGRWADLLDHSSPLLDIVEEQAPVMASALREEFYSVRQHSRSFKIDHIDLPRGSCKSYLRYCPKCIEAAQSPIFHDLLDLDFCLPHGIELITACPKCRTREFWYNAQLFECRCGFERRTANRIIRDFMPTEANPFHSHSIVEEISSKYNLSQLCVNLWEARRRTGNNERCNLPLRVIERIELAAATQVANCPGFIIPLHMAPWINFGSASVAWLATRALHRFYADNRSCASHDCCRFATINRGDMLRAVFGNERQDIEIVLNFALSHWLDRQCANHYMVPPRCQIIRQANAEYCAAYKSPEENLAGLTKDEVATLLNCQMSTVHRLQNQGCFIHPVQSSNLRSLPRDIINETAAKEFAKQSILLDEACALFSLPSNLCEHLMRVAGIRAINQFIEPCFYHRPTFFAMFDHLQSYRLECEKNIPRATYMLAPATIKNIQKTLTLAAALRKDPPNYTSYQMQNHVFPITDSLDICRDALSKILFDIKEVLSILNIPLACGLKALHEAGIDPKNLPHINLSCNLLDIETFHDITV